MWSRRRPLSAQLLEQMHLGSCSRVADVGEVFEARAHVPARAVPGPPWRHVVVGEDLRRLLELPRECHQTCSPLSLTRHRSTRASDVERSSSHAALLEEVCTPYSHAPPCGT